MYVDFHDMDERTGINGRDKEVLKYGEKKKERVVTLLRLLFVLDVRKSFCCLVLVFSFFSFREYVSIFAINVNVWMKEASCYIYRIKR